MTRPLWYLRQFSLFRELPEANLRHLGEITRMVEIRKGEVLYFPEDPSNTLYFLKRGRIQISMVSEQGKELILAMIGPGEIFGELCLADEGLRNSIARPLEDSLLCVSSREAFEEFLKDNIGLALKINKLMGFRRKQIETRLADLIFLSVPSRLAKILLDLSKSHGSDMEYGRMIGLRLTHRDLARLAATTRETVSSLVSEWKKQKILSPETRRIAIRDVARLEELIHSPGGHAHRMI